MACWYVHDHLGPAQIAVVYCMHWVALAVLWWKCMQLAHAGTSQCMAVGGLRI
jgi:hypothetical protein